MIGRSGVKNERERGNRVVLSASSFSPASLSHGQEEFGGEELTWKFAASACPCVAELGDLVSREECERIARWISMRVGQAIRRAAVG